jgi:hypothetical protein
MQSLDLARYLPWRQCQRHPDSEGEERQEDCQLEDEFLVVCVPLLRVYSKSVRGVFLPVLVRLIPGSDAAGALFTVSFKGISVDGSSSSSSEFQVNSSSFSMASAKDDRVS